MAAPVVIAALASLAAKYGPQISAKFSGGEAHGPGTKSRARATAQFTNRILSLPVDTRVEKYEAFLARTNRCANASDPASCEEQSALFQELIRAPGPGEEMPSETLPSAASELPVGIDQPFYVPVLASDDSGSRNSLALLALGAFAVWSLR